VEYLCPIVTQTGLQATPDKIKAIVEAPKPRDQAEL